MQLNYHHDTYELLTQHRIDPQKAIDEVSEDKLGYNPFYFIQGETLEETLKKQAEERERRLAWTKLQLYQRPVQFSEPNTQQLDLLERRYNVKLPAAVREWYSLDIVPQIMTTRGWGPDTIDEIRPLAKVDSSYLELEHSVENLWFFLHDEYVEQGGEYLTFTINAGDDPPVIALSGDRQVELAAHFSEFIYLHFWDWYGHYTLDYYFYMHQHPAILSMQIPERYHIPIERLRQEFSELKSSRGLRFYDEHCRIFADPYRLWQDNQMIRRDHIITGGIFRADSADALKDLIKRLWGDDIPVFRISGLTPKHAETIDPLRRDLLRRVLAQSNDWIPAGTLAFQLGATIPVLDSDMVEHLRWLIESGEVEEQPTDLPTAQAERRFRLKR